jgi:soluble lytic murein transglycosylase-like protein
MTIQPLGPEGVRARMQEIQRKLDEAFPRQLESFIQGIGLTGSIDGTKPLDPFGPGIKVSGAPAELQPLIEKAAAQAGVEANLLDALVEAESGYQPMARSRAGALGLSQLMPGTARSMGVENPFDPWENLQGGAKYLSGLLAKYGDTRTALAAYNAGPGAVDRAGGIPNYPETRAYVEKVMRLYEMRKGQ